MRNVLRLLALVCLGALCGFCVSTANAYGLVQSTSGSLGNSSNPVPFSNSNTAGNTIIVAVGWLNGGTASISDSNNNLYTSALITTNGFASEIWYASNIAGGANTVTVTFSQWNNSTVSLFEYSGLASSAVLDTAVGNTGNSTALNTGSITTTQANDLLFATGYGNSGGTLTEGAGYTMQQYSTWGGTHLGVETQSVTSTGTYSATFSDTQAWTWTAQIAAFKVAGSGDGSGAPTCGKNNDTGIEFPTDWSTFVPPAKGQSYVDSTFGCTVTRITDVSTEDYSGSFYLPIGMGYATISPFNADDTYLMLADGWQRRFITDLTGNTVVPITNMPPALNDTWYLWDATKPNVFYYTSGNSMMSGTISGSSVTTATVHQFTEYAEINFMDETDVSQDGKHVVITGGDTTGSSPLDVFVYDFADDTQGPVYTTTCTQNVDAPNTTGPSGCLHKLIMTPDNNVIIQFATDGTGAEQGNRLWDGTTPLLHLQDNNTNHLDTGYDMVGRSVFIAITNSSVLSGATNPCPDQWSTDVQQVSDPTSAVCLVDIDMYGSPSNEHVAYRGSSSQPWVGLSFFDSRTPSPEWFDTDPNWTAPTSSNWQFLEDEIDVVRIDANNNPEYLYRLARAYSRSDEDFVATPKAAISRDGKYIAFDSNMAYAHTGCPANFQSPTTCEDVYVINIK